MKALERMHKRFTTMQPGLGGITYNEMLEKLGVFSLACWRLWGDLIQVFEIMGGTNWVDIGQNLFPRVEISNTRWRNFMMTHSPGEHV